MTSSCKFTDRTTQSTAKSTAGAKAMFVSVFVRSVGAEAATLDKRNVGQQKTAKATSAMI